MATIKDVALMAGVSMTTVSHVLNGTRPVHASTARKVHAAVEATGYQPSALARSLRRRETYTIGVIVTDIRNAFYTQVVRGLEDVLHRHDYSVILCNSDESAEKQDHYLQVLSSKRVDGLVVVPTAGRSQVLSTLVDRGIPMVQVDRRAVGVAGPFVGVDNVTGAESAVAHLISHGRRHIAIVSGNLQVPTTRDRILGYRRALDQHDLPADDRLIKLVGSQIMGSRAGTRELLALDQPPDAIFASNNNGLLGILCALRDAGVRYPHDVAIMGFDEHPWAEALDPPLSVVSQPTYELGERAATILLSRLAGEPLPASEILLPTTLLTRGSCGEACIGPKAGGDALAVEPTPASSSLEAQAPSR